MDILEVLKYGIIAASLIMCYAEIQQALRLKGKPWAWVKWGLGAMGLYWAVYYFISVIGTKIGPTHQIYVRSPLFLTIVLIACGAIMSMRRTK